MDPLDHPRARHRLQLLVLGAVHGVGFREHVRRRAIPLGIVGTVRNLPDGTVRIDAEGTGFALERLVEALHEGPPRARVDRVVPQWSQPTGEFDGFRVQR